MFRRLATRITATLAATAIGCFAAVTAAQANDNTSVLTQVQERGVLHAGVRYDYPPNSYMDNKGEIKGYGADVARALAKRLGVDIKFVQTT